MIKGVTDRRRNFFPRIAKIRLGVKRRGQSGAEYPSDVDYFVLTDAPAVAKIYGEKPKRLIVMFPSNDIEEIFPTRLEAWKSKGKDASGVQKNTLFCSSDGVTADRVYAGDKDPQGHAVVMAMSKDERPEIGEMFTLPCPHEECPYFDNRACRRVGRLNVVLPEVTLTGTFQIETSSMWGFGNILDTIDWVRKMTRWSEMPDGDFAWKVPLELTRKPAQMSPPELSGKTVIKHVLALEVIDDEDRLKELKLKVPAWIRERKLLLERAADRPEDLFPEETTERALPPVPEPAAAEPKPEKKKETRPTLIMKGGEAVAPASGDGGVKGSTPGRGPGSGVRVPPSHAEEPPEDLDGPFAETEFDVDQPRLPIASSPKKQGPTDPLNF